MFQQKICWGCEPEANDIYVIVDSHHTNAESSNCSETARISGQGSWRRRGYVSVSSDKTEDSELISAPIARDFWTREAKGR